MVATAATSFSISSTASSSSYTKALKRSPQPSVFNLGFLTSSSSSPLKALKARSLPSRAGSAMSAKMVSVPAVEKAASTLDFESSVFKKERVNLAGHEEV